MNDQIVVRSIRIAAQISIDICCKFLSQLSYIALPGELHVKSNWKRSSNKYEANVECLLVNTYVAIVLLITKHLNGCLVFIFLTNNKY